MPSNNWTREEHIVAFNLYCKIPFTKINATYKPVIELAEIIGRTNNSVAMKLANFARLDPDLQARNVSGLKRGAKGEEVVWNEFHGNWEQLAFESEKILAAFKGVEVESEVDLSDISDLKKGKERESIVKSRVNQNFFRKAILAAYNQSCCITGINSSELLVASHIIPWAKNKEERMNPRNGLCLNPLHDKAFDRGLITITPDYILKLSDKLRACLKPDEDKFFIPYENNTINLPGRFFPDKQFLDYHSQEIFNS